MHVTPLQALQGGEGVIVIDVGTVDHAGYDGSYAMDQHRNHLLGHR